MLVKEIQAGDVLELRGAGMLMVRDVKEIPPHDKSRVTHFTLTCAVGRTDDGFELILPGFLPVDVYRSEGTVEEVGT